MNGTARALRPSSLLLLFAFFSVACAPGGDSTRPNQTGSGGSSGAGGSSSTGAGGSESGTGGSASGSGGNVGSGGSGSGGKGGSTATGGATGKGGAGGSGGATGTGGVVATGGATGTGNMGGATARVDLTGKKALIIVDSPTSPDDGEIVLQQVLQVRGMTATFAAVTDAAMATGQNVLLVSSGTAADIATSFNAAAVPMIVFGNSYFQTLGLSPTGSSNQGTIDGHTTISITDASTSLAGGMMTADTFVALVPSRSASIYWGTPGGAAIKVASAMGAANQGIAWAFEKGSMTATATAPARRVCFAWKTNVLGDLTVGAFKLVDAALDWTAGAP